MHILLLPTTFPNVNNPSRGVYNLQQAKALKAAGVEVGVISPDVRNASDLLRFDLRQFGRVRQVEIEGVNLIQKTIINILPGRMTFVKAAYKRLSLELFNLYVTKYGTPDLIHAHTSLWGGYGAKCIYEKYGVPYILTEHLTKVAANDLGKLESKHLPDIYRSAKQVITVSEALKNAISKHGVDIIVIPNLVDVSNFTLENSNRGPNIILSVGRLVKRKGYDTLIRAFSKAKAKQPDLRLRIGGDGPEESNLVGLCEQLGCQDSVEFLGPLSQHEVNIELNNSGIFALSSNLETFGVVFIEAMATGIPVIATRCGGPEEFVTSKNGIVCDKGNDDQIAESILGVVDNYASYNHDEIRDYVLANFSADVVSAKLLDVYKQLR